MIRSVMISKIADCRNFLTKNLWRSVNTRSLLHEPVKIQKNAGRHRFMSSDFRVKWFIYLYHVLNDWFVYKTRFIFQFNKIHFSNPWQFFSTIRQLTSYPTSLSMFFGRILAWVQRQSGDEKHETSDKTFSIVQLAITILC